MMNYTGLITTSLCLLVCAISCKHEPIVQPIDQVDDVPLAEIPCDPDTVYFQNNILPLFKSSCALSGCHDAITAEEGMVLDSYAGIMASGELTAFDLDEGDIWENINETDPDDVMPPPPNDPLTADQIEMIRLWILQGAIDNYCSTCDSLPPLFATGAWPIIENKCQGCHTGQDPSAGFRLDGYDDVVVKVADGSLLGAILHETGYVPMPYNSAALPACESEAIEAWIEAGYLDN